VKASTRWLHTAAVSAALGSILASTAAYASPPDPQALEQRGHRKKVAGAVLMGLGLGLTAVGLGLALDGALHVHCTGHEEHAVCEPSSAASELQLGETGAAFGQLMTVVGIPIYVVGAKQVADGRRLSGQLALQPLASPSGVGVVARLALRF
jgi:hypothetical protein